MGGNNSPPANQDLQNTSLSSELSFKPDSVINNSSILNDKLSSPKIFVHNQIPQYDGNASFSSNSSSASSLGLNDSILNSFEHFSCSAVNQISVIVGNRPANPINNEKVFSYKFLKTLRRDNKAVQGLLLPVLTNYIMRYRSGLRKTL